jgi:DNA-binding transcriptional regulator YdaS (Cro superfamily)
MRKIDVIQYFGSQVAVAGALRITKSAVSGWGEEIPPLRAIQIEEITGGALKADRSKIFGEQASPEATHVA